MTAAGNVINIHLNNEVLNELFYSFAFNQKNIFSDHTSFLVKD